MIDPPHFVFKGAPPAGHQCKFCECYAPGATLSCGVTLADFLCRGGTLSYPQITCSWASQKLDENHEHGRNLHEFISSSSSMPILTTRTHRATLPNHANAATRQDLITLSVFKSKIVLRVNISIPAIRSGRRLAGRHSCLLSNPPLMRTSLNHRARYK